MTPAVLASGIRRSFDGLVALDGVDLEVRQGEVLGLIGPDGAGKTTLLRILVGVLAPDAGRVSIFGHDLVAERSSTRLLVGYLSQAFSLYEDLSVAENIRFFASLRRVPRAERRRREERLLGFTRLAPFTRRLAGDLSGGMKQKLGLVCTLLHEPRVLFLDEPTNGVDPVSRREFWDVIGELRDRVTVVVATPYMDEAERCDRVALVAGGRILALDAPAELRSRLPDPVWQVEVDDPFLAEEALAGLLDPDRIQLFGDRIHVVAPVDSALIERRLAERGQACTVTRVPPSLEDAFVHLAGGGA